MPCERYKDALSEAAASGAVPHGELRAHLDACASCRAAFAQEQSLFSAIDSALHATVNTDVPPSLLPLVRANLDEAVATHSRWFVRWPVLTGAAVSVAVLFAVLILHQDNIARNSGNSVAGNSSAPPTVPAETSNSQGSSLRPGPGGPPPRVSVAKNMTRRPATNGRNAVPEVLVPQDQEVLLASYAQQWGARKRAPLLAKNSDEPTVALLEVAPIQIDELNVKPLAEGNSQ
ncbi:MAG TPA: hypothetical protein VMH48_10910 [Methylomirabilota bacterium]|nr:hypothetical protein [Methylomirabilota bacterium]